MGRQMAEGFLCTLAGDELIAVSALARDFRNVRDEIGRNCAGWSDGLCPSCIFRHDSRTKVSPSDLSRPA